MGVWSRIKALFSSEDTNGAQAEEKTRVEKAVKDLEDESSGLSKSVLMMKARSEA